MGLCVCERLIGDIRIRFVVRNNMAQRVKREAQLRNPRRVVLNNVVAEFSNDFYNLRCVVGVCRPDTITTWWPIYLTHVPFIRAVHHSGTTEAQRGSRF